ncbi:MAG: hypothetical protein E7563_06620 [Ruminococcaceae bacterium]|nr:hypothetical protein [Oscillospiraceae bacterium]
MKKILAFTLSVILVCVAMVLPVSAQTTDTNSDTNNTASIDEATFDEVTADEFTVTVTADYSDFINVTWNEVTDADYYVLTIKSEDHEDYSINKNLNKTEYKWSPLMDCCYFYINVEAYNSEDELISVSGNIVVDVDVVGVWDGLIIYGDVEYDLDVNIKDATLIQKSLADLVTLSEIEIEMADTDQDGEVTIKDATDIQKFVAGIKDSDSRIGRESMIGGCLYNATIVK